MFTTSITTQHTFKTIESSWQLTEKISKYLKNVFKEHKQVSVACESDGVILTVLNTTIPLVTLQLISDNIPRWVDEIDVEEKKKNKENMVEVKKFLKEFKAPTISIGKHRSARDELLDVINNYLEDLKDGLKAGEPNKCLMGDIEGLTKIFHLVGDGKLKEAYKFARSLDTCTRECIPDAVHELIQDGE